MRRLWRAFKNWIKAKVTPVRVIPPPSSVTPTPDDTVRDSDIRDVIDNGNSSNPDWSFIADNAKLDTGGLRSTTEWYAKEALANRERYEVVANDLNIPWWFIAGLHMRESGMSFAGVLHNGDRIIGTGKKTYRVPSGRGPFNSWEESAIDALTMKRFQDKKDWSLGAACAYAERNNGLGYRNKGEYSPYVAAGTTFHDETGKYVRDGKFKYTAIEKQPGVLALWLALGV